MQTKDGSAEDRRDAATLNSKPRASDLANRAMHNVRDVARTKLRCCSTRWERSPAVSGLGV